MGFGSHTTHIFHAAGRDWPLSARGALGLALLCLGSLCARLRCSLLCSLRYSLHYCLLYPLLCSLRYSLLEKLTRADLWDIGAIHDGDPSGLLGWLDAPSHSSLLLHLDLKLLALTESSQGGLSLLSSSLYALQLKLANHIEPGIADRVDARTYSFRHSCDVLLSFIPKDLLPSGKGDRLIGNVTA